MNPNNKIFLTREGLKKFQQEYKKLKKERQLKIQEESYRNNYYSNVDIEHSIFQEEMNFLNSRISELEFILKNYTLITIPPKNKQNVVSIGATIVIEVGGQEDEFILVGTLEANPSMGKISNESLVGKALLGHKVGDEVVVSSSSIKIIYKIKKIKYKNI